MDGESDLFGLRKKVDGDYPRDVISEQSLNYAKLTDKQMQLRTVLSTLKQGDPSYGSVMRELDAVERKMQAIQSRLN